MLTVVLTLGVLSAESGIGFGKMVAGAGAGLSGFGFGLSGNFEFGLTDNIGAMASITRHSYTSGAYDFTFTPIDLWATYHSDKFNTGFMRNFEDVDAYIMAGVTMTSYKWETSGEDDSDTNIAIGFGAGFRKPWKNNLSFWGEGKYRIGKFEYGNNLELAVTWYSLAAGISYHIN